MVNPDKTKQALVMQPDPNAKIKILGRLVAIDDSFALGDVALLEDAREGQIPYQGRSHITDSPNGPTWEEFLKSTIDRQSAELSAMLEKSIYEELRKSGLK